MTLQSAMFELPDIKHAFDLTEDQTMIRDMVREFAESEDDHTILPETQGFWKKIKDALGA